MKNKLRKAVLFLFVAVLTVAVTGCVTQSKVKSIWADGAYTGKGDGIHGQVLISVLIKDGLIADIVIDEEHETEGVSELALEEVPASIIETQSTEVDTVAGASVTSSAVIDAVNEALKKAEDSKLKSK